MPGGVAGVQPIIVAPYADRISQRLTICDASMRANF